MSGAAGLAESPKKIIPMTKTKAFLTSDNQVFLTRETAQQHELEAIFSSEPWPGVDGLTDEQRQGLAPHAAKVCQTQASLVIAALATRKPRAPKAPTVRKSRKLAAVSAAIQEMKQ